MGLNPLTHDPLTHLSTLPCSSATDNQIELESGLGLRDLGILLYNNIIAYVRLA